MVGYSNCGTYTYRYYCSFASTVLCCVLPLSGGGTKGGLGGQPPKGSAVLPKKKLVHKNDIKTRNYEKNEIRELTKNRNIII